MYHPYIMRRGHNRRLLPKRSVDDALWSWVIDTHPILGGLTPAELATLKTFSALFSQKKVFENPGGVPFDESMKYSIAAQACLPILHLGLEWYDNWNTVVVVPKSFSREHATKDEAGVVHEWSERDAGESWSRGPVVLSLEDVEDSGWGDGYNVVIHEAAHRLDLTDGEMNGRPALPQDIPAKRWFNVMSGAFADFRKRVENGERTKIDDYAAESDAEFFAVLSEYFFEKPRVLRKEYPETYEILALFYKRDPMRSPAF